MWKLFETLHFATIAFTMDESLREYSLSCLIDRFDPACAHTEARKKCYGPWPGIPGKVSDQVATQVMFVEHVVLTVGAD